MSETGVGHLDTVKALLDAGVNANDVTDKDEASSVLEATEGQTNIVKMLVQGGTGVDRADSWQGNSLMTPSKESHEKW